MFLVYDPNSSLVFSIGESGPVSESMEIEREMRAALASFHIEKVGSSGKP
jgi:hypothetical protein